MKRISGLILLLAAVPAVAQLEDLYVRGFVSQGYLNTSHNNYLVENSRDGTAEFHEAAVSLQAVPADRWRVGLQFFARDFGEMGNNVVQIDWAYADYQWQDYLGLRFGKFKTHYGLFGQGRDIDMLRSTVFLPQAVYNEAYRDFIIGVEGAGIYGNVPLDDGGVLDYELYVGTLNVPDPETGFWNDNFATAGIDIARLYQAESGYEDVSFLGVAEPRVGFDYIFGGSLRWECPLSGLTLGVSGLTGRWDMVSRLQYSVTDPSLGEFPIVVDDTFEMSGDLDRLVVFSAEWTQDPVTLTAELAQAKNKDELDEGYYLQAACSLDERTTLTSYYSRYVRSKNDSSGDRYVALGYPDFVGWQNDICVALRHDPVEHLTLKLEYHSIDGMGLLGLSQNDLGDPDAYKRYWSFLAAKASVHF